MTTLAKSNHGIRRSNMTRANLSLDDLFVRIASRPTEDLERGYSYSMGCFGDEDQAHQGLSSYAVRSHGLRGAVEALEKRMGLRGWGRGQMFFVVLEGSEVDGGPDGESLCRAQRNVFVVDTADITDLDDLMTKLAEAGISED